MKPVFQVEEFFHPDTIARGLEHHSDGSGFLCNDVVGGREELSWVVEE